VRTHTHTHGMCVCVCVCVCVCMGKELIVTTWCYVIVSHFGFRHDVKYVLPVGDGGGYSAGRRKTLRGSVTVWTAGARRF
jgi:hypothetical protein